MATLQFYFNVFPHYFIFIIPFAIVLLLLLWRFFTHKVHSRVAFVVFVCAAFIFVGPNLWQTYKEDKRMIRSPNYRTDHTNAAKELRQIKNRYNLETAFCEGEAIMQYALVPFNPSAKKEYAFAFGSQGDEVLVQRLADADCFLTSIYDTLELDNLPRTRQVLNEEFTYVPSQTIIEIYIRNELFQAASH